MKNVLSFSLIVATALSLNAPFAAAALTPLKSPEQLAKDEILFASASRSIEKAATTCFISPSADKRKAAKMKPITIRFFLGNGGKEVSQLTVVKGGAGQSVMRQAAFLAIKRCAPYVIPKELQNWGGFWATVTFN